MEIPITGFRANQLDLCLEHKHKFLNYWVHGDELSLPERMKGCDFLETLHLIGNEDTILEDISLIEKLPNIKTLSIQGIETIKKFESIQNLTELKSLTIENSFFDLDVIEKLPLLDELHLANFSSPAIIIDCEKIAKQASLKKLSLMCADFFNERHLTELSQLNSLNLRRNIPKENSKTLEFVKQFPMLEHLVLEILVYSGYSDVSTLLDLQRLQNLKIKGYNAGDELQFQGHDWLTVEFINKLKKVTLEECWLSNKK